MNTLLAKLRALFRRRNLEAEMAEEMRQHLECRTQEKIADGLSPEEARYAAQREFGGVAQVQERCRDERSFVWLEQVVQDLRFAARSLRRTPGFTAVVVLTLALGIGANTAIFSIVHAVLLRPLPYPESERLVWVGETRADLPFSAANPGAVSYQNYVDWRAQQTVFESIGAYQPVGGSPGAFLINDEPLRLEIQRMSADAFAALRIAPVLGRVFTAEEDRPGGTPSVVLSHRTWKERFGGRDVVGQTVSMNSVVHVILGVMPPGFAFPYASVEAWLPLGPMPVPGRSTHTLGAVARLKPGTTIEQARAEMDAIGAQLERAYPEANQGWKSRIEPMVNVVVGDAGRPLWILFGAVGLVLLIACANVANLFLARASVRQPEMAVRAALGAGRSRLVRQLLAEGVALSFLGMVVGVAIAHAGLAGLLALVGDTLPRTTEIRLDGGVLGFAAAISGLTGILFGLAPAWVGTGSAVHDTLKAAGSRSVAGERGSLRHGLIVAEVALTLLLLTGAGLLLRSFQRLQAVNQGFRTERVLSFDVALPGVKYRTAQMQSQFFETLLENLRALPGVEEVGLTSRVPLKLKNGQVIPYAVEGQEKPAGNPSYSLERIVASPGYFGAMGIQLLRGRFFTAQDGPDSPRVVIVDDEFARRHWPGEDPIGRRVTLGSGAGQLSTVIGVVGRVKLGALGEQGGFVQAYVPARVNPGIFFSIVLKSQLAPEALAGSLRREVRRLDAAQPLHSLRTIEEIRDGSLAAERLNLSVLGLFAFLALVLSVVGLYGVLAYSVARRRREIGVRMALGAQTRDVLRLVISQGMRLVGLGLLLGLLAASGLTRWLSHLLFEVEPLDPVTFTAVALLLLAVALLACWVPAHRAARVNPMEALREE